MNPELHDDLDRFSARMTSRRWWPAVSIACAVAGGIYGAALGAAVGAVPGAADVIQFAAIVLALICGAPAARFGMVFGLAGRARLGSFFMGTTAAVAGALAGGFLATMVLLALGAILGAVGGWCLARALLVFRHGILRRFLVGIAGAVLGMFAGAIVWAIHLDPAALRCAGWGAGIGAVVGPLLCLLFLAALNLPPRAPGGGKGPVVDVTFRRDDHGEP